MFRKATQEHLAKQAPSKAPTKNDLARQLFPSSSPSVPRDGDIAEQFRKPPSFISLSSSASKPLGAAKPAAPADPLRNRSVNTAATANRTTKPFQSQNFGSIVNNSNAFQDGPEVIDLLDDSQATTKSIAASVLFGEDDFSDDPDLDFAAPSALPTLPVPATTKTAARLDDPPPATNTSAVSWSSSPASHFVRPRPLPTTAAKREFPHDKPLEFAAPAAKKRAFPGQWASSRKEADSTQALCAVTPAPKAKSGLPWNTTASGVKAQKKQLKSQQKTSNSGKDDFPTEEMSEMMPARPAQKAGINLSNEQRHVKDLVVEKGKSVFFTGPAGTGKSVLMRAIIQDLKKKHLRDPERVAVTASTGLAACNIGGMTLHSFAGIGLGKEDVPALVKKIRRNPKAKNRWIKTKMLIIDEVSMVDGELFDKLSRIGSQIRNNGRPWGGIQLVITGDFFQLPPVPEKYDAGKAREIKFAFEAATWNTSIDHTIGLTEVFRQRDPGMILPTRPENSRRDLLTDWPSLRTNVERDAPRKDYGANCPELQAAQPAASLRRRPRGYRTVRYLASAHAGYQTELTQDKFARFPTRTEVDSSNQRRLAALPGRSYRFASMDTGDPNFRDKLLANMMAPVNLELKKGAQVMLIKNMDDTLVNGSLGKVVGFMSENAFELSSDGYGSDVDPESKFKKRLNAFSNALEQSARAKNENFEYPLVKFRAVDGSERDLLCVPEDWKVELPTGEVQASRKQVPLILAWALSIHKAQGQTLERVKVDLGKVFEKGQAYVALSRATTQQGLQVLRFQKDKVMAHPRVVEFYNKLYSVETVISKKKQTTMANFAYTPAAKLESAVYPESSHLDFGDEEEALAAYG